MGPIVVIQHLTPFLPGHPAAAVVAVEVVTLYQIKKAALCTDPTAEAASVTDVGPEERVEAELRAGANIGLNAAVSTDLRRDTDPACRLPTSELATTQEGAEESIVSDAESGVEADADAGR